MQTIKVTTHWTADQAIYVCEFLDELRSVILSTYSEAIEQANREFREEQLAKQTPDDTEKWVDDEIPF
jgi:hypothetical protein